MKDTGNLHCKLVLVAGLIPVLAENVLLDSHDVVVF